MNKIHAADKELPLWMSNLAEGKITKKASPEEEAFVPYGMNERGTQLGEQTFENFVTELIREDEGEAKVDEEKLEDDEGLKAMEGEVIEEKQIETEVEEANLGRYIPDGTGPHGKGMGPGKGKGDGSGMKSINEKADEESVPPPEPKEEPPLEKEPNNEASPEDEPSDESPVEGDNDFPPPGDAPEGDEGGEDGEKSEMDELKQGLEDLEEVKDFESRLNKIENLLENLQGPATADADENDSIFQSASVSSDIMRSKRIIRRANAGMIKKEDAIKKLNKIFSNF